MKTNGQWLKTHNDSDITVAAILKTMFVHLVYLLSCFLFLYINVLCEITALSRDIIHYKYVILMLIFILIIIVIIIITATTITTIAATSQHKIFAGCSFSKSGFHLEIKQHTVQSIQNSSEYTSHS